MAIVFSLDTDVAMSNTQFINEQCKMVCTVVEVTDENIVYIIELFVKNSDNEFELVSSAMVSTSWGQEAVIYISEDEADSADNDTDDTVKDSLFMVVVAQNNVENDANVARDRAVDVNGEVGKEVAVTEEGVVEKVAGEEVATSNE